MNDTTLPQRGASAYKSDAVLDSKITYVDWGAIFAGAIISIATFALLSAFGTAIGLSSTSALPNKGFSSRAIGIAASLWLVWTVISSFIVGAYFTGRLHRPSGLNTEETEIQDGAHGLVVWALVSLFMIYLAVISIANAPKPSPASLNSSGQMSEISSLPMSELSDPLIYTADKMLRPNTSVSGSQNDMRNDIMRILAVSAANGAITTDDKAYLELEVAARTGINAQSATRRVDTALAEVNQIKERTRAGAETVRKSSVLAGFLTAASLVVGAAASWWAATMGGEHRSEKLGANHFSSWNRRKSV